MSEDVFAIRKSGDSDPLRVCTGARLAATHPGDEGSMTKQRPRTHNGSGTVQSIDRALSLLEALEDSRGEVGIAELSKRVGLHVSTAHRILATLVARGYARQSPETSRYALGAKALHLAESYLGQMDLRRLVRPILERLSQESGETTNLVILDRQEALYLDKVESPQSLRIFSRIGRRAPLHCTAAGKVLLAYRSKVQVEALLGPGPLERLTRHTITSVSHVRRELEKVREHGFALDREECEEGACCIAVPVRNAQGEVEAALGISAPTTRLTPRRTEELIPIMLGRGQEASAQLGFTGLSR
jgi:IclR family acetate operon transcriptional repressor